MNEVGAEQGLRAVEADARDEVVFQAEHIVGVGDLRRCAIGIGVGGLVVELRIRAAIQEVRDERAAQRGAETCVEAQQPGAIVAGRVVRRVAVGDPLQEIAVVGQRLDRGGVGHVHVAGQADRGVLVADLIRRGELGARVDRQQLDRRGAGAVEHGMRRRDVEVQLGALAPPADIAVDVLQIGRLQIAPAVLVQHRAGDIGRCVAGLLAVLELALDLTERAAGEVGLEALPGEAVLELDVHRAAEGVEAEHRVGALEIDPVDGDVGDQVPVHRVAERLIEPNAVDIDREPLRGSLQRRSGEAVIEECRLKRIARSGIQADAADLLVQ